MIVLWVFYGIISLAAAEKTYYCSGKLNDVHYCSYTPGDPRSNIVINAPHGGELLPKEMRPREAGCLIGKFCRWEHDCGKKDFERCKAKCVTDHFSGHIAKQMTKDIEKITGIRPYLIVNEVQRGRYDGNREIRQATYGNPSATRTFHEYHDFIRNATESVKSPALFIEMHGQRHPAEWIEIGYMIKSKELDEGAINPDFSSVRGLFLRQKKKYSPQQMISGNKSIGYLMQNEGYKIVPSPAYPGPAKLGYYKGGFNMKQHAPMWNERLDAIQVEVPNHLRNLEKVPEIADALARAIVQWVKWHYQGKDNDKDEDD